MECILLSPCDSILGWRGTSDEHNNYKINFGKGNHEPHWCIQSEYFSLMLYIVRSIAVAFHCIFQMNLSQIQTTETMKLKRNEKYCAKLEWKDLQETEKETSKLNKNQTKQNVFQI